jgi:uncharacterized surface protein with fasciclin (FAS1) repeats
MKKFLVAAMLTLAVPAVAQFPNLKVDTKKLKKDADKEAKKAEKEAQKEADKEAKKAEKDAKKAAKEAIKATITDTLALPHGTPEHPVTFAKLTAALAAAELDVALKGKGPFTLFAPSDAAFAKLPEAELAALLANKEKLRALLGGHVVDGVVMAKDVKTGKVKTHTGAEVNVEAKGGKVAFGGAHVLSANHECTNGVIHVIDTVVMPK